MKRLGSLLFYVKPLDCHKGLLTAFGKTEEKEKENSDSGKWKEVVGTDLTTLRRASLYLSCVFTMNDFFELTAEARLVNCEILFLWPFDDVIFSHFCWASIISGTFALVFVFISFYCWHAETCFDTRRVCFKKSR